jgi:hypothetical protein
MMKKIVRLIVPVLLIAACSVNRHSPVRYDLLISRGCNLDSIRAQTISFYKEQEKRENIPADAFNMMFAENDTAILILRTNTGKFPRLAPFSTYIEISKKTCKITELKANVQQ